MSEALVNQRFAVAGNGNVRLPVASNLPLDIPQPQVTRAFINIHGSGSPAFKYYARAMQALRGHDGDATLDGAAVPDALRSRTDVLVIAPQFMSPGDYRGPGPLPSNALVWSSNKFWGEDADNGNHPSSFLVLDELLRHLCDPQRYRNLRRIVLAGHSGGGQILNRYAAAGDGEDLYAAPRGIRVRYVVMNPGSYVYFDARRRVTTSEDSFATYVPPSPGCMNFNNWGYGTALGLPGYVTSRGLGHAELAQRYSQRDVIHLVGAADTATSGGGLPVVCAANVQGASRVERSRTYFNYLTHFFGRDIMKRQQHAIVPGVGHSGGGMIRSAIARRYLMEDFEGSPRLRRTGDSGDQAGKVSRVAILRHWDDVGDNADDQYMTAVRDSANQLRLIAWRAFQDGSLMRSASSRPTADSARSIGMVRRVRIDTLPDGTTARRLTYITAYVASGSRMRLASWDCAPQGAINEIARASGSDCGRAALVRIVALSGPRFATVQRDTNDRLIVKTWEVGDGGALSRIDTTGVLSGAVDEVQIIRRSRSFFLVLANTPTQKELRLLHFNATSSGSAPGALTLNWDTLLPGDAGTDLCGVFGPYGPPEERLAIGYRTVGGLRLRLVSLRISSSSHIRLYDSGNQVGQTETGTSIMAMAPYGLCTAVRTTSGKARLMFWRMAPGGRLRRVADTGSNLGPVGRHHALAGEASAVSGDLAFACSDANDKLKVIRFRYHS